jgi:hypothetical protein
VVLSNTFSSKEQEAGDPLCQELALKNVRFWGTRFSGVEISKDLTFKQQDNIGD